MKISDIVLKRYTAGIGKSLKWYEWVTNPKTKEEELKELANKHLCKHIRWKDTACIICGYSIEFDCLIAGTHAVANGDKLSDTDVILSVCANYFYVPKDIVKE